MECLEPPYSKNKGKGREGYLPVNNIVMKWKGIIFDLDGVLCSTDQYHYMAWKRVADQLPVYFDEEINQRLRGVSRAESLEIILEKYTGTPLHTLEKQKILAEKNQIYRTALEQMNEQDLSAEVRDTILRLREKGYSLAVGSSSKNARFILGRLGLYAASAGHTGKEADMTIEKKTGLANVFDAIIDGTQITHSKPHPEVFQKAAAELGLKPKVCLVVEDAAAGVEAAHRAGMEAACVGQAGKDHLGDYNLENFKDILSVLNE